MEKWEHIVCYHESEVNSAGYDGYELVSVICFSDNEVRFYMKRKVIV